MTSVASENGKKVLTMSEPTCGLNYEAENERLKAENAKLREKCSYFEEKLRCTERENEILRAKMSMVYLIFGGDGNSAMA